MRSRTWSTRLTTSVGGLRGQVGFRRGSARREAGDHGREPTGRLAATAGTERARRRSAQGQPAARTSQPSSATTTRLFAEVSPGRHGWPRDHRRGVPVGGPRHDGRARPWRRPREGRALARRTRRRHPRRRRSAWSPATGCSAGRPWRPPPRRAPPPGRPAPARSGTADIRVGAAAAVVVAASDEPAAALAAASRLASPPTTVVPAAAASRDSVGRALVAVGVAVAERGRTPRPPGRARPRPRPATPPRACGGADRWRGGASGVTARRSGTAPGAPVVVGRCGGQGVLVEGGQRGLQGPSGQGLGQQGASASRHAAGGGASSARRRAGSPSTRARWVGVASPSSTARPGPRRRRGARRGRSWLCAWTIGGGGAGSRRSRARARAARPRAMRERTVPGRDVQHLGDLGVVEAHARRAARPRRGTRRAGRPGRRRVSRRSVTRSVELGPVVVGVGGRLVVGGDRPATPPAQLVEAGVGGHPVRPRAEGDRPSKRSRPRTMAIRPPGAASAASASLPVRRRHRAHQPRLVAAQQVLQGAPVTRLGRGDQRGVVARPPGAGA